MSHLCPNCDLEFTEAPWRYDEVEQGIHWVCPTDERVDTELVYAPVSLAQAIASYLAQPVRNPAIG